MTIELNSITSGYSTGLINDNFQSLEDYINDKLLNRDGVETGEVNQMEASLDMNSHFVYNLPEPVLEHQAARLQDVQNAIAGADSANLISFTPYGSITSGNVQGAIQELEDQAAQDPNTLEVDTNTGTQTLQNALNERASILETDLTVNIPTDYPTLQAAVDALSTVSVKQGVTITLNIETGHALTNGLFIENTDASSFKIASVDAVVTLAVGFTPASNGDSVTTQNTCIIGGKGSHLPEVDILIDASLVGGVGVYLSYQSKGIINAGKGVTNADSLGLFVGQGSSALASSANFSGARYGSRCTTNSRLNCPGANFSGTVEATYAGSGTTACLDISRGSIVNAASTGASRLNCSGGAARGISVRRSFASIQSNTVSNSSGDAGLHVAQGSHVFANDTLADSCVNKGVLCTTAWVDIGGSNVNNSGGLNVYSENGGFISALFSDLSVSGDASQCVLAQSASELLVNGSNCRRVAGVDNSGDISVSTGSRIVAVNATGGLNQIANTFGSFGYIIQ